LGGKVWAKKQTPKKDPKWEKEKMEIVDQGVAKIVPNTALTTGYGLCLNSQQFGSFDESTQLSSDWVPPIQVVMVMWVEATPYS